MVLEHQTLVHNRITKANYSARKALAYEQEMNRSLGEPEGHRFESTNRRIQTLEMILPKPSYWSTKPN